jgi:hypothetical protein
MVSVVVLSVVILSVTYKPYMQSVAMLSVIMLSVIMLSVFMLCVVMLIVVMLSVFMLCVVMLIVVMLSAVVPETATVLLTTIWIGVAEKDLPWLLGLCDNCFSSLSRQPRSQGMGAMTFSIITYSIMTLSKRAYM